MIVRELKYLNYVPMAFDYFNDYKDTRAWCLHNCPEMVAKLDKGYALYVEYTRG